VPSIYRRIIPDVVDRQKIHALPMSATAYDAARQMLEQDIGAVVVTDAEGRMAGIVTERDLTRRILGRRQDPEKATLGEVMTRMPDALAPNDTALGALEMMRSHRYRHLPVVSGERVVGMVSIRDLYAAVIAEFDEEVRESRDILYGGRPRI